MTVLTSLHKSTTCQSIVPFPYLWKESPHFWITNRASIHNWLSHIKTDLWQQCITKLQKTCILKSPIPSHQS